MNRLKELRIKKNLSFRELEKALGIDKAMLNQLEKGKVKLTETRIKTFCDFFHCTPNYLLGYEEEKKLDAFAHLPIIKLSPQTIEDTFNDLTKNCQKEDIKKLIKYLEVYVNE